MSLSCYEKNISKSAINHQKNLELNVEKNRYYYINSNEMSDLYVCKAVNKEKRNENSYNSMLNIGKVLLYRIISYEKHLKLYYGIENIIPIRLYKKDINNKIEVLNCSEKTPKNKALKEKLLNKRKTLIGVLKEKEALPYIKPYTVVGSSGILVYNF